jgi:hypothetical protein
MKYVPAKYALVSAFGLMCMGGAAMACPNPALSSGGIPVSASDQIQSFQVMAGGENTLEACGLAALGTGQFRSAPDFSFDVSGMQGREMDLSWTASATRRFWSTPPTASGFSTTIPMV